MTHYARTWAHSLISLITPSIPPLGRLRYVLKMSRDFLARGVRHRFRIETFANGTPSCKLVPDFPPRKICPSFFSSAFSCAFDSR
jgi:hypothetical protein